MTALSDSERTAVRRFCGYPIRAAGTSGIQFVGHSPSAGALESRLTLLTEPEIAVVRRYLATLTALELAIPRSSENLDTDQAAVWKHNVNEVRDRIELFDDWRRRLSNFLGVPFGSAIGKAAALWLTV